MATKYEYRVSGIPNAPVIDNNGNFRPNSVFGNTYFVDYRNGSDSNNGLSRRNARKTFGSVYNNLATSNNNDYIFIDGDSAVVETAMVTCSKNRVHTFCAESLGRVVQQNARIQMGVTGVATDLAPIMVTGVRNSFVGIKVENASTTNESLYGFIDNGEGTFLSNFSSLKTAGLNDAGHAHFWMAGDSLSAQNCTFGQSNIPSTAAVAGILIDAKSGGGSDTVKECFLENIKVNMSVSGVHATSFFIKIADTAAMNFVNEIDNFTGTNFIPVGGTILTDAISAPSAIVSGTLFLINPAFAGCTGSIDNGSAGVQIVARGVAPVAAGGLATNVA